VSYDFPPVCICLPVYNAAGTVRETLTSILTQTYPNLVVHVSDNASTDNSLNVIESLNDSRIIIHRNTKNIGGEGNFTRCIHLAEGKYTAIFHADDVYEPDMVSRQVAFLENNPEAGAVFTEASLIDELGKRVGAIHFPQKITSNQGLYDFDTLFPAILKYSNFFICPSFMVHTQIYKREIEVWRGDLFRTAVDLDVWLRILQNHMIGHIPSPLINYRISNNHWSAKVRQETERADFFLVVDHYLAQKQFRKKITKNDLRNYRWLDRRDRVMRSVNYYLTDRPHEASDLMHDLLSWDGLNAAIRTKRGLFVMVIGLYMKALIFFGLSGIGKWPLDYTKRVYKK
jgi:glycosyltransferase involved in cell wall biosynthesis